MTHRACRPRTRTGHLTAAGPVTPTRSRERWGRAETERTALGEALVLRRRTRVRFPPPPPATRAGCHRDGGGTRLSLSPAKRAGSGRSAPASRCDEEHADDRDAEADDKDRPGDRSQGGE